ncbi:L-type lectin-domain containing receptor kinase IX.2-like [Triticum dicoccoides]|uniref:L-type lectin-domain containing receptor kinase IX.2-like n=1 Tax=Triticum dicoccoides TaxID=85692 RepID=UPI00188DC8A0|nr:L-type lectin-domain containing receptor kinase IX.2-like [Triticum dicoccoides]
MGTAQLLLLLLACLHCPLAAAVAPPPFSFSFDFTNTSSYRQDDLKFEGNATVHGNLVDLTCNSFGKDSKDCVGRVSYAHRVPFYDNLTGEVASFQTRFTFVIMLDNNTMNYKGDGMAFFLAYYPSTMPATSGGGNLGLMSQVDGKRTTFGKDQFIAVEFDTYNNSYDPSTTFDHIGIDINSVMDSVNTTRLPNFSLNGSMTATVTFDNTSRMLIADLRFDDNDNYRPVQVSTQLPHPVTTLLPDQVAVGFSAATGSGMELHQLLSWSFNSTLAPPRKDHDKKAAVVGWLIGGAMALLVLWCIISYFKWTRSTSQNFLAPSGGARQLEYRVLAAATDDFSEERVIGQGAFGVVYRGTFFKVPSSGAPSRESDGPSSTESCASSNSSSKESTDDIEVAVKKIKNGTKGGDFLAEMNTISEAKHKNLVKLKGWCCRENNRNLLDFMCWCCREKKDAELFLVYELVPNGNLYYHLSESEQVIAWPTRYQIVKDIGSALVYLHHECEPYILHRDIKPGNILLDNKFNAKLADFGLSRIGNQDNMTLMTTAIGTEGYIDPECRKDGKVKFYPKSDVYSFGIVLLDIVCTGKSRERVWELYIRGKVMEATDGRLHGGDDLDRRQMKSVAVLGLWCSLPDGAKRPTVRKAMEVLERDESLPDLNYRVNTSVPSASGHQHIDTSSSDQQAFMSDES